VKTNEKIRDADEWEEVEWEEEDEKKYGWRRWSGRKKMGRSMVGERKWKSEVGRKFRVM
jgi:hypothetical protein